LDNKNREHIRKLLEYAGYTKESVRDLELYSPAGTDVKSVHEIVVLDNDLPVYYTTVDDLALRKSPTLKEMVSIRNAIRILNDGDVLRTKRETTLLYLQKKCLEKLDISYTRDDIKALWTEGKAALDACDSGWVKEILVCFATLAGWFESSYELQVPEMFIFGKKLQKTSGECFSPVVVYQDHENNLMLSDDIFLDVKSEKFAGLIAGHIAPSLKGYDVLTYFKDQLLST
jgi:hypothetical protein